MLFQNNITRSLPGQLNQFLESKSKKQIIFEYLNFFIKLDTLIQQNLLDGCQKLSSSSYSIPSSYLYSTPDRGSVTILQNISSTNWGISDPTFIDSLHFFFMQWWDFFKLVYCKYEMITPSLVDHSKINKGSSGMSFAT